MERSERIQLQNMRRRLEHNLAALDHLLKKAAPPRRFAKADIRQRAAAICQEVRTRKGVVSKDQLRTIVTKHDMPYTAVGALFAGGYLKDTKTGVVLGSRGQQAVRPPNRRTKAKRA